ncbi:hypothetical protein OKA04_05260 [Luteolibacter flavescens]|uniref:DUF4175 domain-containing protein n=1 Tax=Luteolibacter flavescens TaxID=1859460 RepID=A0ABT3FKN4_9BACT|nr:DUF4175 family protein [Luteolibacter flavescens]MCW1884128.1 hypothetical protein [Luteolibacter flavescens]
MKDEPPPSSPVIEMLRRAGAVESRHRALRLVMRSLVWIALAVPLLMVADILFHFSDGVRLAGSLGVAVALVLVLAAAAVIAFFARPPLLRVARLLESRDPSLGSKLVNLLQLDADARSAQGSELTRELAGQAVQQAARSVDSSGFPVLARDPQRFRYLGRAMVLPVLLGLVTLFGGADARREWLRFLDPHGDHPPLSFTRIEIEKPEAGTSVLYGESLLVIAKTRGHIPKELFLTARPEGGGEPFTVAMIPRGEGIFVAPLEKIHQPLEVTAHTRGESSRSQRRRIDLILTPQIGPAVVTIAPPAYTGQPAREVPFRFTALQALEGTAITFRLGSNRPLGEGKISLLTAPDQSTDFPLLPAPEGAADSATASLTATASGRLSYHLVDIAGHAATETPTSTLTVTRDQPPSITVTAPERDAFVVEKMRLPLVIDATDDYGLRSVRLHVGIDGKFGEPVVAEFDKPDVRRHRVEHQLDLAAMGANADSEITVFAEAVDTRPEPQMTRTGSRRMGVITEEQYNEYLRQRADVAMIAGKYENLLARLQEKVEAQREIEKTLKELQEKQAKDPDDKELEEGLAKAFQQQDDLNHELEALAEEMSDFGREDPVYDFEKELQEQLREQAGKLRESAKRNREETGKALESGPPPSEPPTKEQLDAMAQAAQEQRERLEGERQEAEQNVQEPLQDLAQLHELMKDFNLFKQLEEQQRELAEQSKAYEEKQELTPDDRLAMREMGAKQRELGRKLDDLARKLEQDAAAAKEEFPQAAESAQQLADAIGQAGMPGMAREAAQDMLEGRADGAHPRAQQLHEEMEKLFAENGQPGLEGVQQGMDQALRLERGMNPGNSFRQMMQSLNFRPGPGGGSGKGASGMMASGSAPGDTDVIGGESLMDGPMSQAMAGRGDQGGAGMSGAPTARIDAADSGKPDELSSRRTTTPGSSSLLMEYENIADAYFRRLTTEK